MKRVFLDTNVLIDYLLDREGADDAADILQMGEEGHITLAVSFLTMANTAYIVRKGHTQEQLYVCMSDLSAMLRTLPMTEEQLKEALSLPATDFEDMLQYICAKTNGCDVIVTRNTRHFSFSKMPVLTPAEFLQSGF